MRHKLLCAQGALSVRSVEGQVLSHRELAPRVLPPGPGEPDCTSRAGRQPQLSAPALAPVSPSSSLPRAACVQACPCQRRAAGHPPRASLHLRAPLDTQAPGGTTAPLNGHVQNSGPRKSWCPGVLPRDCPSADLLNQAPGQHLGLCHQWTQQPGMSGLARHHLLCLKSCRPPSGPSPEATRPSNP